MLSLNTKEHAVSLTFIVPVYNTHAQILIRTITRLSRSTRHTILVVDDGSSNPETLKAFRKLISLDNVKVLHKPHGGKVDALRYALRKIRSDYVFIVDDDVIIEPNKGFSLDEALQSDIELLNTGCSVVVYPVGSMLSQKLLERTQNVEHLIPTYHLRSFLRDGLYVNGTGSLWKASDLIELLTMHSGVHEGDDLELTLLAYKHGMRISFSDSIFLYALMKNKLIDWFIQRLRWEYGKWRLIRYLTIIIDNPYISAYYFASVAFMLTLIIKSFVPSLILLLLLFYGIIKTTMKSYVYMPARFFKDISLVIPLIISFLFNNLLSIVIGTLYYYILFKFIERIYEVKNTNISFGYFLAYIAYITLYIAFIQPLGLAYTIVKSGSKYFLFLINRLKFQLS